MQTEEGPHLIHKEIRLLEGREVPALGHFVPMLDVPEAGLHPGAHRCDDLFGEHRHAGRNVDRESMAAALAKAFPIELGRGHRRSGHPDSITLLSGACQSTAVKVQKLEGACAAVAVLPGRPANSRCDVGCGHSGAGKISESTTGPMVVQTSAVAGPGWPRHPSIERRTNARFSSR